MALQCVHMEHTLAHPNGERLLAGGGVAGGGVTGGMEDSKWQGSNRCDNKGCDNKGCDSRGRGSRDRARQWAMVGSHTIIQSCTELPL